MGKIFKTLTLILFLVCAMTWVTSCEKEPDEKTDAKTEEKTDVKTEEKTETIDYGTLSISDIKVEKGKSADINPVFSISDKAEEITYTFEGNNISIENGKVTGLVGETETVVTAKTLHHEITFKVVVWIDYGTLSIADINVTFGSETLPIIVFSKEEHEEDIEYQFEGNNISIIDGIVKGLVPDTTTVVTAKTQHHEAKFNVNVSYVNGVLTNDIGDESKLGLPTPTNVDNYLFLAKVNVDAYRINGWTRLSAFAYNGSDNSWYNIEMNEAGNVMLYARFNGVEKYHIFLFNINEEGVLVDGKFSYEVAILKVGQSTKLFVNGKPVCLFTENELNGYPLLGALEVTACANRANPGSYQVQINNSYYVLENTELYNEYLNYVGNEVKEFDDVVLEALDGTERKFVVGNLVEYNNGCVFETTVTINEWDKTGNTRPSAFAFNGSDNSWYNIELNPEGNATLYGRFNGVEKYHIHLFNANDEGIMVEGKIQYKVAILKEGQNTYFFINNKLVCQFSEAELNGYPTLVSLEFTSCNDVWRDGGAFNISYTNMKISASTTQVFADYKAMIK
jgi:hypothetical protein